jgi:glycerophosphoryl diester phosphodiesterase
MTATQHALIALFVRCATTEQIEAAHAEDADGVSMQVALGPGGRAMVGSITVSDAVAAARGLGLEVELALGSPFATTDTTRLIADTVASLVSGRHLEHVTVTSFDHAALVSVGRGIPDLSYGLTSLAVLVDPVDYAVRTGASSLHPLIVWADPADAALAHAAGVRRHGWTFTLPGSGSEADQLAAARSAGFDAVTVTDLAAARAALGASADGSELAGASR